LSGRGLCDELITRPEESYRLCYVVVCDLETSRMGAPYIYDISHLRVNGTSDDTISVCGELETTVACFKALPRNLSLRYDGNPEKSRDRGVTSGVQTKYL